MKKEGRENWMRCAEKTGKKDESDQDKEEEKGREMNGKD